MKSPDNATQSATARRLSLAADFAGRSFELGGRSDPPDPATHAFRKDLADISLAGQVIASHYAEPLLRHLAENSPLMAGYDDDAEMLAMLTKGDEFYMLDCSLGWSWGYAGNRVGYIRAGAIKP